ncbi:hypothetical protein D9756_007432 [Leucocoprinus leucothites]|uniref:Uncharacterized protein n=1 Tax=Leucocoprinus leucothites TaxID=201217 RepID=A0A8H5FWM6_9AGAR|nr:hypothetical protein D9756_007432 [Leucoagaricus leucothites]
MPTKGNRTGSTAQLRSHSRSSSATRISANLQLTQKDNASARGSDKGKKNPHAVHEGGRPAFARANSSQRVPPAAQLQRTGSSTSATQQQHADTSAKANANFTLTTRSTDEEEDDDEWVSSSGAQTPNKNGSDSDTASEGSSIPQELVQQLQRTQLEQQRQHESAATTRAQAQVPRVDTVRQLDFNPLTVAIGTAVASNVNGAPKSAPPVPTQMPFPTDISESNGPSMDRSPHQRYEPQFQEPTADRTLAPPALGGGDGQHARETNHSRPESRQTHSKRKSVTRPPSTHSMSGRLDSVPMRPHPLIRGHSQGYLNVVPKPTPLAPLTVITDQPPNAPDSQVSGSPESIRTTITSPGGVTAEFPSERRTSISSARSVSTLPAHSSVQPPHKPYDRTRTLSTMSMSASSNALNSLAHLPSVTRPPSPQLISFFPPVNPHVNIEAIHPLLPGPYLNNHLTVLARRTPLRESYDRVIQAKIASGR